MLGGNAEWKRAARGLGLRWQGEKLHDPPPLTENPISEGGKWMNGKRDALDWSGVRTIPGFAFGTEIGGDRPESGKYDDSTALLSGAWGPDQTAQATVQRTNKDDDHIDLELRPAKQPLASQRYRI